MTKSKKNLKEIDKTKTKKERNNNGGGHMRKTYSLNSLENEETTFWGLTIKNWAIGMVGIIIIVYNINYNKQLLEKEGKQNTTIYKI